MIPTNIELVDAAAATYDPAATPAIQMLHTSVRVFQSKSADGTNIIAIEGTHDVIGWLEDFLALEVSGGGHPGENHPVLGWVHAGFLLDAMLVLPSVRMIAQQGPFAICGHSLGAALALLLGAILTVEGTPPVKIGAFAPPRVGGEQFAEIVKSVSSICPRYGDDVVPEVPFTLKAFPYIQVPLLELEDPKKLDRFVPTTSATMSTQYTRCRQKPDKQSGMVRGHREMDHHR